MRTTLKIETMLAVAREVGLRVKLGDTHKEYTYFTLALGPVREDGTRRFQRMSARYSTGKVRRIGSVCFHGHYAFMAGCFEREPEAIIESQLARYEGRRDFQIKAPEVGYGRPPHTLKDYVPGVHGQAFTDACTCTEEEREELGGC